MSGEYHLCCLNYARIFPWCNYHCGEYPLSDDIEIDVIEFTFLVQKTMHHMNCRVQIRKLKWFKNDLNASKEFLMVQNFFCYIFSLRLIEMNFPIILQHVKNQRSKIKLFRYEANYSIQPFSLWVRKSKGRNYFPVDTKRKPINIGINKTTLNW